MGRLLSAAPSWLVAPRGGAADVTAPRPLRGAARSGRPATTVFSALAGAGTGQADVDPLFSMFFGVGLGQIAAIAFGTTAVSSEFRGGALAVTLTAVPRRGRWFPDKAVAIAVPVLGVGLVTGGVSPAVGKAVLGAKADAPTWGEELRGVVGRGVHMTLMALLAAGLTAVLRSGVATLSVLIPFLLIVSFVVGDMAGSVADVLPDRAGQVVFHETWGGAPGPWPGLGVTGLRAAAALPAGAWSVRRRDA